MNNHSEVRKVICTTCAATFDVTQESTDVAANEHTPHKHRWLSTEHPDRNCEGPFVELDLLTFRKRTTQLSELREKAAEDETRLSNLESSYSNELSSLKDSLANSKIPTAAKGIQSLILNLEEEFAIKATHLRDELSYLNFEESRISQQLQPLHGTAAAMESVQNEWANWSHEDRLANISNEFGADVIGCQYCHGELDFDSDNPHRVPSHIVPNSSGWCRNSGEILTNIDLKLIGPSQSTSKAAGETSFGGGLGEEDGASRLWTDPKEAIKDIRTTVSARKVKPQPNRDRLTPNDKDFYGKNIADELF